MKYLEWQFQLNPFRPFSDILVAELGLLGFESFEEDESSGLLKAYIAEADAPEDQQILSISLFQSEELSIEHQKQVWEDQNWNATWESNFDPVHIGNFCLIRASFHQSVPDIRFEILIDPKMSFGTGHHQTTFLMVEEMEALEVQNKAVLDMGCGTGVLAILAKKMGAEKVMAIDIDEWAYNNTIENIQNNQTPEIEVLQGGAEKIGEEQFHLVLANINRNILMQDMKQYVDCLFADGHLLLSGFFTADESILLEKAKSLGMSLLGRSQKDEWSMLHLVKK